MVTYREYIVEYATKAKTKMFGPTTLKHGQNGKSYDRAINRVHVNTVTKTYKHKHPLVDRIVQGQGDNISISGRALKGLLTQYNIEHKPGIKTLGSSGVMIQMFNNGAAILRHKK